MTPGCRFRTSAPSRSVFRDRIDCLFDFESDRKLVWLCNTKRDRAPPEDSLADFIRALRCLKLNSPISCDIPFPRWKRNLVSSPFLVPVRSNYFDYRIWIFLFVVVRSRILWFYVGRLKKSTYNFRLTEINTRTYLDNSVCCNWWRKIFILHEYAFLNC